MSIPKELLDAAREARENAYAPYSGFQVGAALRMKGSDDIWTGANVENASYGATLCAERVALCAAVASELKEPRLEEIVIVAREPVPPCGMCLQVIREFADPETRVHLASPLEEGPSYLLRELLPHSFSSENL